MKKLNKNNYKRVFIALELFHGAEIYYKRSLLQFASDHCNGEKDGRFYWVADELKALDKHFKAVESSTRFLFTRLNTGEIIGNACRVLETAQVIRTKIKASFSDTNNPDSFPPFAPYESLKNYQESFIGSIMQVYENSTAEN